MSTQLSLRIGKTIITIEVERCTQCGTPWSHDWGQAKTVDVVIGKKTHALSIPICGDCMGVPNDAYDDDEKAEIAEYARKLSRNVSPEQRRARQVLKQLMHNYNLSRNHFLCALNLYKITGLLCASRYLRHAGRAQEIKPMIIRKKHSARVTTVVPCDAAQLSLAIGE